MRRRCVLYLLLPQPFRYGIVHIPLHQSPDRPLIPHASLVPWHEEVKGCRTRQEEQVGDARLLLLFLLVGCAGVRSVVHGPAVLTGEKSIYAYEAHPPLAPHLFVDTYLLITDYAMSF